MVRRPATPREWPRAEQRGLSLVELLVATTLGLVLVAGVLVAHQHSQAARRAAESLARMQEVSRLAFDVIEADVRMAGYWGKHGRADAVTGRAGAGAPLPAGITSAQGTRIDLCGGPDSRWAIDLERPIDGTDDAYRLACRPVGGAQPDSDVLVLRRASDARPASLDPDRIHVQTSHAGGVLFVPSPGCTNPSNAACLPPGFAPGPTQTRLLVARAYYVASSSTQRPDVPALRRKSFGNVNAASVSDAVTDEEIASGVEQLQVMWGLDLDGDGGVDTYASPGEVPAGAAVVAATIHLRVRSVDGGYAAGSLPHIEVARTIRIRNVRP